MQFSAISGLEIPNLLSEVSILHSRVTGYNKNGQLQL